MSPKIIECFIFYNELAMLEYKLHLLYPIVDHFVLVESTKTFIGSPKELFFQSNKQRFERFLDKIVHIVVDDMPESENPWVREEHQRNAIDRGLQKLSLNPTDLVIVSDVDEILNPQKLQMAKKMKLKDRVACFLMDIYYYNFENYGEGPVCEITKIAEYSTYKDKYSSKPHDFRYAKEYTKIPLGGWHLTFFGDTDFILNKIKHYSHQEFNKGDMNKLSIEEAIEKNQHLFFRDQTFKKIPMKENSNLPPDFEILVDRLEECQTKPKLFSSSDQVFQEQPSQTSLLPKELK